MTVRDSLHKRDSYMDRHSTADLQILAKDMTKRMYSELTSSRVLKVSQSICNYFYRQLFLASREVNEADRKHASVNRALSQGLKV